MGEIIRKDENGNEFGKDVYINCKLSIGKNCRIYDRATLIGGEIKIGNHVWIGQDTILTGTGGLTIEDDVIIGFGAYIITANGTWGNVEKAAPVVIKKGSWIMSRANINPGVTIGPNSVVRNCALVTHDVGPNSIVQGIPARVAGWRYE